MPSHQNLSQRAYVAVLTAMLVRRRQLDSSCHGAVASYLIAHPHTDADLVLVGDSFGDQMPLHCFLRARDGRRLADSNRVCILHGHSYQWTDAHQRYIRGVILSSTHVAMLTQSRQHLSPLLGRRLHDRDQGTS